ncbi:MAG: type I restriction enzyme HsdR N-terminal domain-containing protein [Cyanobacteria bacterium P01_F01_bin.3]
MTQTIVARDITLRELKQTFGLSESQESGFFSEWSESFVALSETEKQTLDRVKENFSDMVADLPVLEDAVKLVVLAPLLDLAGFYRRPYRIETETSIEIEAEDEGVTVRGRIDVLVLKERLWLLVIESKRSDFSVTRAISQALSYMLADEKIEQPTFGMITNGSEFLFLKAMQQEYGNSRLFSLVNPGNELWDVLQILKRLGEQVAISSP